MINIYITVKHSTRFPGKNKLLFPATQSWLMEELPTLTEPYKIHIVGQVDELEGYLDGFSLVECHTGSHRGDLEYAVEVTQPDDVSILIQLTQPVKRRGLLNDVIEHTRAYGVAITGCVYEQWRTLDIKGHWGNKDDKTHVVMHDGALYGWMPGRLGDIFDHDATHAVVINHNGLPVDIDYKEDLLPVYDTIKGDTV